MRYSTATCAGLLCAWLSAGALAASQAFDERDRNSGGVLPPQQCAPHTGQCSDRGTRDHSADGARDPMALGTPGPAPPVIDNLPRLADPQGVRTKAM